MPPQLQQELFPNSEEDRDAPIQRKMTRHLLEALQAARESTERAAAGDGNELASMMKQGVSANLCDALVRLIKPFSNLDVGVSWARTRPAPLPEATVRFGKADSPILEEAARLFRERAPREDVHLPGFVQLLRRPETEDDGIIHLTTHIDGQPQAVRAVLEQSDYGRALQAHRDKAMAILTGDLERKGQRWRLLNAQVEGVIPNEAVVPDGEESVA